MDQEKIGKLIARLRRAKNLTQQDLGDIVGVGHQAVSKWERGNCLPDISIINKLCEVLDITSDELLKGELNETHQLHLPKKHKYLWIPIVVLLIAAIGTLVYINKVRNKPIDTDIYILGRVGNDYHVSGQVVITSDDLTININEIELDDIDFKKMVIKNYQYELHAGDMFIYGYGSIGIHESLDAPTTIGKFLETFKIEHRVHGVEKIETIINNNLMLIITFLDENDDLITKNIEMKVNSPSK